MDDAFYTRKELQTAKQEAYDQGLNAGKSIARWRTWNWEGFYVAVVICVFILAGAGLWGWFRWTNVTSPQPTLDWTTVDGIPCVLIENPDFRYNSEQVVPQEKTWLLCKEAG